MTVLIQDSVRNNLASWVAHSANLGWIEGVMLSPFASPIHRANRYKQAASTTVSRIQTAGCRVWFDPMTHALQMPGVGDFRYYSQWDLWPGNRGDLSSDQMRREHIERIFKIQDAFGAPRLAPTVLLANPQSPASELALSISNTALELDPDCWLSMAGDVHFWSSTSDLDAHVGALAQLQTPGWVVTVVRALPDLPVQASAHEIFGLLRTVRSLTQEAAVYVAFGDMAALPAIAAGAQCVGTGWDARQRVCAYTDYRRRTTGGDGGQWYRRPTLEGLLGSLTTNEYELLRTGDVALATQLTPGIIAPGAEEAFVHHASTLARITLDLRQLSYEHAFRRLMQMYDDAVSNWTRIARRFPTVTSARQWVTPFRDGLALYGAEEGW